VIDAKDGSIVGTIDLGGEPEQAVTDGKGHLWVDLEDKKMIAAVDAKTLTVTARYDIAGQGGGPGGLAFDAKNHILFATCQEPNMMVILNSDDGKIITSLPIGNGTDGAVFNPARRAWPRPDAAGFVFDSRGGQVKSLTKEVR
jgi:DNA-binding beta-propeller fold protein YncE